MVTDVSAPYADKFVAINNKFHVRLTEIVGNPRTTMIPGDLNTREVRKYQVTW